MAELAACDLALGDEAPVPLTFDQLIAEAVCGGGSADEVAGELLRGCPSRERRHWDHLLSRVEAALARTR